MRLTIGAHFACKVCLRRGFHPVCAACGDSKRMLHLARKRGRRWLDKAHASGLSSVGTPWWRPRWRSATWVTFSMWTMPFVGACLLPIAASVASTPPGSMLGWILLVAIGAVLGALGSVVILLAVIVAALAAALLVLVVALLTALVQFCLLSVASSAASRLGALVDRLLGLFPFALRLGPRLRIERWQPAGHAQRLHGTVAHGATVLVLTGKSSCVDAGDGHVAPFEVETSGAEQVLVELQAGSVIVDAELRESGGEGDSEPPWWSTLRARTRRCLGVAPGTPVELVGGQWSERTAADGRGAGFRHAPRQRVLTGTADAPLELRIGRSAGAGPGAGRGAGAEA